MRACVCVWVCKNWLERGSGISEASESFLFLMVWGAFFSSIIGGNGNLCCKVYGKGPETRWFWPSDRAWGIGVGVFSKPARQRRVAAARAKTFFQVGSQRFTLAVVH